MPVLDVTQFKYPPTPPQYPCPVCGKESKERNGPAPTKEARICSNKSCRAEFDLLT